MFIFSVQSVIEGGFGELYYKQLAAYVIPADEDTWWCLNEPPQEEQEQNPVPISMVHLKGILNFFHFGVRLAILLLSIEILYYYVVGTQMNIREKFAQNFTFLVNSCFGSRGEDV